MAVTRRTRIASKEVQAPAEDTTVTRRRRPAQAPAAEETTTTTAARTRRRPVAAPSPELTQVIEIIEKIAAPAAESSSFKVVGTDYDRVIAEYRDRADTPKKAIRAKCVECMGGMIAEVNRCSSTGCPLYPFRLGENPFHALSKHNPNAKKKEDKK